MKRSALILGLVASAAFAEPSVEYPDAGVLESGSTSVTVRVGESRGVGVGGARGLLCDDLSIAQAELTGGTRESNVLMVKGLKVGTTHCRAGLERGGPHMLVEIRVVEKL